VTDLNCFESHELSLDQLQFAVGGVRAFAALGGTRVPKRNSSLPGSGGSRFLSQSGGVTFGFQGSGDKCSG